MRHSLRPALSLCQKNLYMLLHCPIGGTPDGCISASSYIKDRDWTRPSSSKFLLLTIGRALLRASPICSQLDASSFEYFPLACNSWHPIAFLRLDPAAARRRPVRHPIRAFSKAYRMS